MKSFVIKLRDGNHYVVELHSGTTYAGWVSSIQQQGFFFDGNIWINRDAIAYMLPLGANLFKTEGDIAAMEAAGTA